MSPSLLQRFAAEWSDIDRTANDPEYLRGIALAALSALKLPHAGDDGWQDIATAPRDGTPFLAYNPMIGVYNTAFTTRWTGDPDETGYEGFPCGFWHLGDSRSYPFGKWDCVPTHWRPLPTPPAKGTPHV